MSSFLEFWGNENGIVEHLANLCHSDCFVPFTLSSSLTGLSYQFHQHITDNNFSANKYLLNNLMKKKTTPPCIPALANLPSGLSLAKILGNLCLCIYLFVYFNRRDNSFLITAFLTAQPGTRLSPALGWSMKQGWSKLSKSSQKCGFDFLGWQPSMLHLISKLEHNHM